MRREKIVVDLTDSSEEDNGTKRMKTESRPVPKPAAPICVLTDDDDDSCNESLSSRINKNKKRRKRITILDDSSDEDEAHVTGEHQPERDSISFEVNHLDCDLEAAIEASRRESAQTTPPVSNCNFDDIDFDEPFDEPPSSPVPRVPVQTVPAAARPAARPVPEPAAAVSRSAPKPGMFHNDDEELTRCPDLPAGYQLPAEPMPPPPKFTASTSMIGKPGAKTPRNNLEQMIEYVSTFSLEGRIRQLNPGKRIDMTKLKRSITEETDSTKGTALPREYGVYDRPSDNVPFVYEPPKNAHPETSHTATSASASSHTHTNGAGSSSAMAISLDDIDWDEDILMEDGDPVPSKHKSGPRTSSPIAGPSTSSSSSSSGPAPALAREFKPVSTASSADAHNVSLKDYEQNDGCDPELKRTDYPHSNQMFHYFRNIFKLENFRKNQLEVMNATLLSHDVFCLMPTGGGKSLCYQLPALCSDGTTIVISPLKSLIYDQVTKLQELNINVANISGDMSSADISEVYKQLKQKPVSIKMLYVTPERIGASPALKDVFDEMYRKKTMSRIVIDEAHCVSQWGHDFRPDYKKLNVMRERYPGVPIMAVTATANPRVRVDVCAALKIQSAKWFIQSFNRPNLKYEVRQKCKDSLTEMMDMIRYKYAKDSGIIYCLSRKDCDKTAGILRSNGISSSAYHAGLTDEIREKVQKQWITGKVKVICATIAFGMGIDKADVRFVFHYCVPKSMEGYYQEAGRAGRDGKLSQCILYYSPGDVTRLRKIITGNKPISRQSDSERAALKVHIDNLNTMTYFAQNRSVCRRIQLMRYLGEPCASSSLCLRDREASCDNCESDQLFIEKDVTEEARKLVETVHALYSGSGKKDWSQMHYMSILSGSTMKKLVDMKHDRLPGHGLLKSWAKSDAALLFRKLIMDQYLKEKVTMNRAGMANVFIVTGPKSGELLNRHFSTLKITMPLQHDPMASNTTSKVRKTPASTATTFTYANEDEYEDDNFDDSIDDY
jgi:RecQ family ATP-dependent DNA helicase